MGPPRLQDTSSRAVTRTPTHLHIPVSQGFGVSDSQRGPIPAGAPLTLAFYLLAPLFLGELWAFPQYYPHPAEETGASSGQPPPPVSVPVTCVCMTDAGDITGVRAGVVLFHSLAWSVLLAMLPEKDQIWPPSSRRSQCREERSKRPVIRPNGLMSPGIHFYGSLQKENLSR